MQCPTIVSRSVCIFSNYNKSSIDVAALRIFTQLLDTFPIESKELKSPNLCYRLDESAQHKSALIVENQAASRARGSDADPTRRPSQLKPIYRGRQLLERDRNFSRKLVPLAPFRSGINKPRKAAGNTCNIYRRPIGNLFLSELSEDDLDIGLRNILSIRPYVSVNYNTAAGRHFYFCYSCFSAHTTALNFRN